MLTYCVQTERYRERMQHITTTPVLYKMVDHDKLIGSTRYLLRVRDMEVNDKPRDKLAKQGPSVLSMAELVAVMWSVGTRKEDVLEMARRVLKEYGERAILYETNPDKLAEALMIPKTKPISWWLGLSWGGGILTHAVSDRYMYGRRGKRGST